MSRQQAQHLVCIGPLYPEYRRSIRKGAETQSRSNDPGNRPSTTIILNDLLPENIGRLLSFYEAKTIYEAFLLDINPFDQFGVELGKKLAKNIRDEMIRKNESIQLENDDAFEYSNKTGAIERFYLDSLFSGRLE